MPTVERVQIRIRDVEGFDVIFLGPDGHDVHDNMEGMPQYSAGRAASNNMTVERWKEICFHRRYPGFDVAVLDGNGARVHGGTILATVREAYQR
jgi:2-keto-3-deoxy-L-rhamnonate aldolase RhmA